MKEQLGAILIWNFRLGEPSSGQGGQSLMAQGIERLAKALIVARRRRAGLAQEKFFKPWNNRAGTLR
jgi:hypothetical protein